MCISFCANATASLGVLACDAELAAAALSAAGLDRFGGRRERRLRATTGLRRECDIGSHSALGDGVCSFEPEAVSGDQ